MVQRKKLFRRMLINNWGGISHKVLEFHEYVNLFSGKSGSGKSTVMDAIQVVLYGSVSANFLNKAADDSKNKRSVLSYLRGAQKDGTANREGVDFCSQIVLEIEDTGTHLFTCVGVAFEVGKNDQELRKYNFFSHSGRFPEDEYLTGGVPYSVSRIRKLTEERNREEDGHGHGDVNRVYPSKEAYLNMVYGEIFGYLEPGRMITMEKSAIALKMTSGTDQFIRDYMFPRSKEDTVETISEQLGAYREIRERVEDLEQRISMLSQIQEKDRKLTQIRADKVRGEQILRYIDIESCLTRLASRKSDLEFLEREARKAQERQDGFQEQQKRERAELVDVKAELKESDYGRKEQELEELEKTILLLEDNAARWRSILDGLGQWEEDEVVTDYVSNRTLQLIAQFRLGEVTEESCGELKRQLGSAMDNISEERSELQVEIRDINRELKEKNEAVEDMKNDRKPYPAELKKARQQLQTALSDRHGRKIPVYIFADLFDITDSKWKDAVEGRLGRIKRSMITEPAYAFEAAEIFRKMKQFEDADLINSAAIMRDSPEAEPQSLYEAVHTGVPYADRCLKRFLGKIRKCETVEELDGVKDGVTPDCYSCSGYIFRHLRKKDYTKNACIGTRVSRAKLGEMEEEILQLQEQLIKKHQAEAALKEAQQFERLGQEPGQLVRLSEAEENLKKYRDKQEYIQKELDELKAGRLMEELRSRVEELSGRIERREEEVRKLQKEQIRIGESKGNTERDIRDLEDRLDFLRREEKTNEILAAEVRKRLEEKSEQACRQEMKAEYDRLLQSEAEAADERTKARNLFNNAYPSYGFDGVERDNTVYDKVLEQCRNDFEPGYKEEFKKQYELVYHSLRDNVIAAIHGEIKAAYRHRKHINRMLSQIRFSDSVYQIDILPARNEAGQFYEMLTADELDSKVPDGGMQGQASLLEDEFFRKYGRQIELLTQKFMPPRDEDGAGRERRRQEMKYFADYRNYLTFSMYEKSVDQDGNEKKNYVDDMAGVDSGGEGQNPKYVALLAGFAMLYMQQSNRDSKICLVLLDEAFSKMDKERSEVCLKYARQLGLQLIVCVPDERLQSLIRNVDSVYGFRRFRNQVSMMHIDKGHYLNMIEGSTEEAQPDRENSRPHNS